MTFANDLGSSVPSNRAYVIYQAPDPVSVATLAHELGHILGLAHYDDDGTAGAGCKSLRNANVDPNGDHFTVMTHAGTACRSNLTITGRGLRDLYEAYHPGPIIDVHLSPDADVVHFAGSLQAILSWEHDITDKQGNVVTVSGALEAGHAGTHAVLYARDTADSKWEYISAVPLWQTGKVLPMGYMQFVDTRGLRHSYKLVAVNRVTLPLHGLDGTVGITMDDQESYGEGDPTVITFRSTGKTIAKRPEVLSASLSPRYCTVGGSGINRRVLLSGPTRGTPSSSVLACPSTAATRTDTVVKAIGSEVAAPKLQVDLDFITLGKPKPVKFDIAPSAAPGTCNAGSTVSIGWRLASDSGGPVTVNAHGESSTTSPLEVVCPPGVATGSSVEVWALRKDGGGRQVTATATQPLTVGGLGTTRDCVSGEDKTTYFQISGGNSPYADHDGKPYTARGAGGSWAFGYRCPSDFGPTELTITVTDGVGRTATAPLKLNVTCALPLSAPSFPYSEVGGTGSSAIRLTWSEVCAESYRVRYSPADLEGHDMRDTDQPPVTIDRLAPNTIYRFTVQALAPGASSPESVAASMRTAPPSPRAAVRFDGWAGAAGGPYSVLVSWPEVDGAADYEAEIIDVSPGGLIDAVRIGTAGGGDCAAPKDKRARRFCGLTAAGVYQIEVEARNGDAAASDPGKALACLGPCGLRVSGVTTGGLRLDWEGLHPSVLIHNVRLREGGRVVRESATSRRWFRFGGLSLKPETTYRAEVRTLYGGARGYTPWAGVAFTTPEAPAPQPLGLTVTPSAASCLTGETVEISWSVEGGSGRYTISLDGAEQTGGSAEVTCQGTAGTQTFSLVAADTVHTTLTATQQVTLTVSVPKVAAPTGLSVAAEATRLTLGWQAVQGATGYGVRRDGGAEAKLAAATTSHPFSGLEPSTKYELEVRAYTGADHSLWSSIEGTTAAPEALVLTAEATPTSCETNAEVTVSWTVTGGSGSHTVSVDGSAQSGSSVQVTCQAAAGTQSVIVTATDATYGQLTATQTLSLTVTKPAPPATVEAQVRARRLSDHRVEFALRLKGGSDLTTAKRYLKLPEVTAGRWYQSGAYTATVAGVDYTLGVVSARLDNTVCPAQLEVTFIPTGGERITPEQYKLTVDREADLWAATSAFAVPLKLSSDSVRAQADTSALMTEAPRGAADGPGREGGLMFGDAEPGVDAARTEGTETVCTAQPTGLATSAVTASGARLAWDKVTGASEYDAAVGEGEPEALDAAQLAHDFTGLAADTDHTLRVRARSWRGSSKWSAIVVRTKPSPVPVLTITAGTSPVAEGTSAGFTVTSDRTTTAALTVKLSVAETGDVTSGAAPSEATIAAGARTAAVAVATEDDDEEESDSVVTATLLAGSGYRLGSVSSASVTVTDDDGQVPPLTLTATAAPASCETGGEVTVSWSVTGGSGTHAVTVDGAAQTGASATVTCQATVGTQNVAVTATDTLHTQLSATETVTVPVVEPVVLSASVSPTSCETGGEVTVNWSATGGSGSHTVTVDGAAQTGASTKVTCQATAGTQNVAVTATDTLHTQLSVTQTLSLTVTRPAPGMVEAQIRARRLSDNRVELTLRLANGTILEPDRRFAAPPAMTDLAWKQSEQLSAEIGGTSYPLGTISVRLQNDRCPSRVELSFLPAAGERISPAQRFLPTNVKLGGWYATAKFAITLSDGGSSAAARSTDGEPPAAVWLDDTEDATGAGPGTDVGLMEGEQPDDAASAERALSGRTEAATNCPAAPSGLTTSGLSASQVTLSWGAVTGASQYDVRRDGGAASKATSTSHTFSGLSADTTYRLEVRARDAWGASGWSAYSETTWPLSPAQPTGLQVTATTDSLTLTWGAASRATGYEVRIGGRTVKTYGGAARSHRFARLSADTEYTLGVRATNRGGASGWAAIKKKTKPTPLSLTASVAPGSCEPGERVTVSWTVTGGSGSHTVTVDGVAQTGSSAKVTCQQAAGRQTIAVVATDALHTSLRASESLPVTVASPPSVSGQVAARLLSSGKIEFGFRPTGGSRILPRLRIYTPDTTKLTKWTSTSEVYGPAGTERNRLLGKVTVKHVKTTTGYYVDVCFRAAGASQRSCPSSNNFHYQTATVGRWLYTGTVTFTPLRATALSADALQSVVQDEQMQAAAPGEGEAAGSEGGLMSDEE